MKAALAFEKQGIDPVIALKAVYTSSGGSTSLGRLIEYVENNNSINLSFTAKLLVKDMGIAFSMLEGEEEGVKKAFDIVYGEYSRLVEQSGGSADIFDMKEFLQV